MNPRNPKRVARLHFMDTRLYVNAGMRFPLCYSFAKLLDTDKSRLAITGNRGAVTCKRCLAHMA